MRNKILLIVFLLLFSGCDDTPVACRKAGYTGIVVPTTTWSFTNNQVCSNGDITKNGYFITYHGFILASTHEYLKFSKETK